MFNRIMKKLLAIHKGQSGLAMMQLLMSILVTGVIGGGAAIATIQILEAPDRIQTHRTTVETRLEDVRQGTVVEAPSTRLQGYPQIDYAVIALNGDVTMGGNSRVKSDPETPAEGDVYASGNINMSGKAQVKGDATATGSISKSGGAVITGTETENLSPALQFRNIENSIYAASSALLNTANSGGIHSGNMTISSDQTLGPIHITGNLLIDGNSTVTLTGVVFVDGTITMTGTSDITGHHTIAAVGDIIATGNTELDADNLPFITSFEGDITIEGNVTSGLLYAPNGYIILSGNSDVRGAVIGRSVTNEGNNIIEYPTALGTQS